MAEPQSSVDVSTKLERVAKLAREAPDMAFRSLAHLIDIDWLREAYRRTRKDGARGVDGVSAQEYQANLEDNLRSLLERAKSGTYRAPPVRRVHIPKVRIPARSGQPFRPDLGSHSGGIWAAVPMTWAAIPAAPGQPFR